MAVAVSLRLLRRATQVNRADDCTLLGVDHSSVGSAVAQNEDPFRQRLEDNTVRRPCTGMVLIVASVVEFHIRTGLLLLKP